jgi:hypothetical protein
MTASHQSVRLLLRPVLEWLSNGGDAWQMDLDYWSTRHELMGHGEIFDGPPSEFLSHIDTAMDVFSPDEDRGPDKIDEAQLKHELEQAIAGLRRLGYLTEE